MNSHWGKSILLEGSKCILYEFEKQVYMACKRCHFMWSDTYSYDEELMPCNCYPSSIDYNLEITYRLLKS